MLLSGVTGAAVGFAAAALWLGEVTTAPATEAAAASGRSTTKRENGERANATDVRELRPKVESAATVPPKSAPAAANDPKLSAALEEARSHEREVQKELGQSRKRIAELERELGVERKRDQFDLTPDDWRDLAAKGVVKYRVPCANVPQSYLSDAGIERLGLAPDDREVLAKAYQNSAARLRKQLLPLCAKALDNRIDLAEAVGVDSCTRILISTAKLRGENQGASARKVAAVMAGDMAVGEDFTMTDIALLALTQEGAHFEAELAESFGPEEAHRIAFAPELCATSSSFTFGPTGSKPEK